MYCHHLVMFSVLRRGKGEVKKAAKEGELSSRCCVSPAVYDALLLACIGEGSAAVLAEAPKKRPLVMMSEQGVHCCCLFMFCPCGQTHRTLLPPDDEVKSQDVEESKSEAIAASISTSWSIAASNITPAPKRLRPQCDGWEAYKAWVGAGRPRPEQQQATTKKKPASRQKREFWEYYEPALDNASKYWDVVVTLAGYCVCSTTVPCRTLFCF